MNARSARVAEDRDILGEQRGGEARGARTPSGRAVAARVATKLERVAARVIAALLPKHLMRNKRLFDIWEGHGYHVLPVHFYEPVPMPADRHKAAKARSELVGVDLNSSGQLTLLKSTGQ